MDGLAFSLYVNALIVAIFETVAYIATDYVIVRIPRKKAVFCSILLACTMLFMFTLLKTPDDCGKVCTITIIQVITLGV
jgi:hypothetical protein